MLRSRSCIPFYIYTSMFHIYIYIYLCSYTRHLFLFLFITLSECHICHFCIDFVIYFITLSCHLMSSISLYFIELILCLYLFNKYIQYSLCNISICSRSITTVCSWWYSIRLFCHKYLTPIMRSWFCGKDVVRVYIVSAFVSFVIIVRHTYIK